MLTILWIDTPPGPFEAPLARSMIALCMIASPAFAQAQLRAASTPPTPVAAQRQTDAAVDHGLLISRAETLRAGEVGVDLYEVIVPGLSAGLTDHLEMTALFVPPADEFPTFWAVQAKYAFMRTDALTFAARLNMSTLGEIGGRSDGALVRTGRVDVAADYRFGTGRHATGLHAAAGATHGDHSTNVRGNPGFGAIFQLGADAALGEGAAVLAELRAPTRYTQARTGPLDEPLIGVGLRLHGESVAFDVGALIPLARPYVKPSDSMQDNERLDLMPWVSLSTRFQAADDADHPRRPGAHFTGDFDEE